MRDARNAKGDFMLTGDNIVCFAKDWTEDPTSNNHVMRLLAVQNKVLWLNSIATRTPNFSNRSDVQKIGRKLKSFAQGPRHIKDGLSVYTPIVLPFPYSKPAIAVNRKILQSTLGLLRRRLGMDQFQLWTFLPNAVEYVGKLGESLVVYYCTDEFSHFSYLDGEKMGAMERELCQRADIVFTTARTLLERKKIYNPETHLASHGVDYVHFAKALRAETQVAPEVAALKPPVIGFFGLLQDWVDIDLLATMAERRPDWSIVLIGKSLVDTSRLARYPNIHLLGRKPYSELPQYCKGFSVGIIPFLVNELTRNVNPIKLREYFSAGLPVVSSYIPEVTHYPAWCSVANGSDDFIAKVAEAIATDSDAKRRERSEAMKEETWEKKVEQIGAHIARVQAKKRGGLGASPRHENATFAGASRTSQP
jgi:glycosyltransferase involved in cell wall biosynthesis